MTIPPTISEPKSSSRTRRGRDLRIATYNLNGVQSRLGNLLDWLKDTQPDAVCLQELKAPDDRFPCEVVEKAGYGAVWLGQKSWNGVAILAKGATPVETRRGLPGDSQDVQSRYIEAAVEGVLIGSLYVPNGNPRPGPKFDYKLDWLRRLRAHGRSLLATGHDVVLAGDFNIIPEDIDVYAPERWREDALFHIRVREAYRDMLSDGWADALRSVHPDEQVFTFWKYLRNAYQRDAGLRIDHLLISPSLRPRLENAGVDRAHRGRQKASDHAAVWIDLADRS